MSFVNEPDFQDDFRKVGEDATSAFEAPGAPSNPTERASSENLDVAAKAGDPETEDLEEDDLDVEEDEDDDEEEDDDDDDLDDDDEEEDDFEDDEDDDEDDDEEDDDEESDVPVKARLNDVEVRPNAI